MTFNILKIVCLRVIMVVALWLLQNVSPNLWEIIQFVEQNLLQYLVRGLMIFKKKLR